MKIKHEFDAAELQRRVDNAVAFYEGTTEDFKTRGAIVAVSENSFAATLLKYEELRSEGYTLADSKWHSPDQILVRKPQRMVDLEIADIISEITATYTAERKQAYDAHVESIVAESVARTEREAAKKAELAREKAVEAARKDALAALGVFS